MQAQNCYQATFFEKAPYNEAMHPGGRPSKRKRPELGERIAQAREQAGISQYELADQLGVSQQQVVRWEREVSSIRSDSLVRIAMVLNVSCDELLGLKPLSQPTPRGRLQRLVNEVSELPRRQQERLLDQVEDSLTGYKLRQARKAS